jgi:predicted DNA-binding transcriptional regulator AlpA
VDLVTSGEIAEMLCVSRPRVHQLSQRRDFPPPKLVAGGRRLWERKRIERWAASWDRTNVGGRPRQSTEGTG